MCDQDYNRNLELPLATTTGRRNATIESHESESEDGVKIDKNLLIDITKLRIGPVIHEGSETVVYEGLYKGTPVAIKIIQREKTTNVSPEHKERFEREVRLLSKMKHENIVKFVGASMEPVLILVTELMRGGSLQNYLWNARPFCLDLKDALSFALGISRAMEYLHANGIIHRDLKPSNLLLTEDKKTIKLSDLGLSREEVESEISSEAGTFRWMAPEVFNEDLARIGHKKHYNHKVDVYSFSLILWELLTNNTPFKGLHSILVAYAAANNKRPSLGDIPSNIGSLLTSCWANDPEARPEFVQISALLENILNNMPPNLPKTEEPSPENKTKDSTCLMGCKAENKWQKKNKLKNLCCCFASCVEDEV